VKIGTFDEIHTKHTICTFKHGIVWWNSHAVNSILKVGQGFKFDENHVTYSVAF